MDPLPGPSNVNVNVNDRFKVWNPWRGPFRPTRPPFTSLSTDEASLIKCLAYGDKPDSIAQRTAMWLRVRRPPKKQHPVCCFNATASFKESVNCAKNSCFMNIHTDGFNCALWWLLAIRQQSLKVTCSDKDHWKRLQWWTRHSYI